MTKRFLMKNKKYIEENKSLRNISSDQNCKIQINWKNIFQDLKFTPRLRIICISINLGSSLTQKSEVDFSKILRKHNSQNPQNNYLANNAS